MNTPLRRLIACGLLLGCAAGAAWSAVDVNRADQASLESVKGIGPALSGKLLAERQKAPFRDWSDLIGRVGGVGPGSAQRLSDAGLTVEGKPYAPGGSAAPVAPRPAPARPAASR